MAGPVDHTACFEQMGMKALSAKGDAFATCAVCFTRGTAQTPKTVLATSRTAVAEVQSIASP